MTVNDRGPFVDGRIIDLSYASARLLGMADNGVAKVRVQGISDNPAIAAANAKGAAKTSVLASAEVPARQQKPQVIEKNIVERTIVEEPPRAEPKARRQVQVAEAAKPRPAVKATAKSEPKPEPKSELRAENGKYAVQVGAFSQDDNARRVQKKLVQSGYDSARITRVVRGGREFMAVQAGTFVEREKAEEALRTLRMEFPASFISTGA
jgi:rare lipoprotein A